MVSENDGVKVKTGKEKREGEIARRVSGRTGKSGKHLIGIR